VAEERIRHKRVRDEQYSAKVTAIVIRDLKKWEEDRTKEERHLVSKLI